MTKQKIVFIEWSKYNSRGASLSSKINARMFFIGKANIYNNAFISLLTYIPKSIKNIKILLHEKPDVIIITNTIWVIAFVNYFYSKLFGIKLILDSHSCAFDHTFFKYPLFLSKYFAKKSFLSIVTNETHYTLLNNIGANSIVINDIPFEENLITNEKIDLSEKFNICYVCTFAEDEPYLEVLKAVENMDEVIIYVTGNYQKIGLEPSLFPNVKFLGFVSNEEYRLYMNNVDAIMTLTTREDTMQRAGSEAISVRKPLITSNTKMLRETFHKGTVYVGDTSSEILKGIVEMKKDRQSFSREMAELQSERKENFFDKLDKINKKLEMR
jgi:glycosyltransferase involved in cell wall biosynthesis